MDKERAIKILEEIVKVFDNPMFNILLGNISKKIENSADNSNELKEALEFAINNLKGES